MLIRWPLAGFRRLLQGFAVLAAFSLAGTARAQTPAQVCISAHADGQVARGSGELLLAKARFLSCAADLCPPVVREDCNKFAADVEAALPTVVLALQTANGQDVSPALVQIDGSTEKVPVDGRARALDPGRHEFRFSLPDGSTQVVSAVLREAEKYRRVVAVAAPSPPRAEVTASVSPVAYLLGGFGVVAAGSFTYFALEGKKKENELEKCAPDCRQSEVDTMRTRYLIADLSLGASLVSLGVGAYLFFQQSTASTETSRAATRVDRRLWLSAGADARSVGVRAVAEF